MTHQFHFDATLDSALATAQEPVVPSGLAHRIVVRAVNYPQQTRERNVATIRGRGSSRFYLPIGGAIAASLLAVVQLGSGGLNADWSEAQVAKSETSSLKADVAMAPVTTTHFGLARHGNESSARHNRDAIAEIANRTVALDMHTSDSADRMLKIAEAPPKNAQVDLGLMPPHAPQLMSGLESKGFDLAEEIPESSHVYGPVLDLETGPYWTNGRSTGPSGLAIAGGQRAFAD
jgi:hypothetical protein